jgi:hypothetical protein
MKAGHHISLLLLIHVSVATAVWQFYDKLARPIGVHFEPEDLQNVSGPGPFPDVPQYSSVEDRAHQALRIVALHTEPDLNYTNLYSQHFHSVQMQKYRNAVEIYRAHKLLVEGLNKHDYQVEGLLNPHDFKWAPARESLIYQPFRARLRKAIRLENEMMASWKSKYSPQEMRLKKMLFNNRRRRFQMLERKRDQRDPDSLYNALRLVNRPDPIDWSTRLDQGSRSV